MTELVKNQEISEQKMLENIIEVHFKALEFYMKSPEKNKYQTNMERITIIAYIGNYGASGEHPKYWEYSAKLALLSMK